MSEPVCHLEEFHLTRMNVAWHEPRESGNVDVSYGFDYDVSRHVSAKHRYRLRFRVDSQSLTPEPIGYALDCEIVGFFSFPESTPQKDVDCLIRHNGCTILYGILRGQLATITGSFPHRKLILPTVMMEDVVKEVEERKGKAAVEAAK